MKRLEWLADLGRIVIRFSYDPMLVEEVKSIAGRRWHRDQKFWSIPIESAGEAATLLLPLGFDPSSEVEGLLNGDVEGLAGLAQLVAENIALQLERRIAFRRAMKKAVQTSMSLGAEGIRVQVSGRLGGADIARTEMQRAGRVPLHTLRENIDYGFTEARTGYGVVGVKCWICVRDEDDPFVN